MTSLNGASNVGPGEHLDYLEGLPTKKKGNKSGYVLDDSSFCGRVFVIQHRNVSDRSLQG